MTANGLSRRGVLRGAALVGVGVATDGLAGCAEDRPNRQVSAADLRPRRRGGTLRIGGTATFNGPTSLSTVNLSGTLQGTGLVTIGTALNWTGGTMQGAGTTKTLANVTTTVGTANGKTRSPS